MLSDRDVERAVTLAEQSVDRRFGGNSSVTRVDLDGQLLAVKDYSGRSDADVRLNREMVALALLHDDGLDLAPAPMGAIASRGIGIQSWVTGEASAPVPAVQDFMTESLGRIHGLAGRTPSHACGPAADAIRSAFDVYVQVHDRMTMLQRAQDVVVLQSVGAVAAAVTRIEIPQDDRSRAVQTLSPSDFGPHNIVVGADGSKVVDLEFFGWDDAHKLVCDTLLHPLVDWTDMDPQAFLEATTTLYGLDEGRLARLMPWMALKWSTIVLARADRESARGDVPAATAAIAAAHRYGALALACEANRRDGMSVLASLSWER